MLTKPNEIWPAERLIHFIMVVRNQKVNLPSDHAKLDGVEGRRLTEPVRRNIAKFQA